MTNTQAMNLLEHLGDYNPGQRVYSRQEDGINAREAHRLVRDYPDRFARAVEVLDNYFSNPNRRNHIQVLEAMTTSDFPLLFGDALDKMLMSEYNRRQQQWRLYVDTSDRFRDFKEKKRYTMDGQTKALDEMSELSEYKERNFSESEVKYKLKKYGNRHMFSMEFFIEDDLGAFKNLPKWLAIGAETTQAREVTKLFVDASGPHASLYTSGNGNIITSNPVLSIKAIEDAYTQINQFKDADGEPIIVPMVYLVVPPALEIAAKKYLAATELEMNLPSSLGTFRTANVVRDSIKLVVNHYIPAIASTANGNTSWFMFADPNNNRPALAAGYLAGHERPEVFVKIPNQRSLGGGTSEMDGDFEHDAIEHKIRLFFGTSRVDAKMTVASNGSGS